MIHTCFRLQGITLSLMFSLIFSLQEPTFESTTTPLRFETFRENVCPLNSLDNWYQGKKRIESIASEPIRSLLELQ